MDAVADAAVSSDCSTDFKNNTVSNHAVMRNMRALLEYSIVANCCRVSPVE